MIVVEDSVFTHFVLMKVVIVIDDSALSMQQKSVVIDKANCVNIDPFHHRLSYYFLLESFSNFVYPGRHELNFHSCEINEDCGDRAGVICDFLTLRREYKVCQCRFGWLLDPRSQICGTTRGEPETIRLLIDSILVEQRCRPTCDVNRNFECRGYQCVCKQGFQFNGTDCGENQWACRCRCIFIFILVSPLIQIELGEVCNRTEILPFGFNGTYRSNIICDQSCGHYRCSAGFRVDGARCSK